MKLSTEQKAIILTDDHLIVNAVAGSGKTTTLIAYARSKHPHSKILYLAFNKSVKYEALKRFQEAGLGNVRVETAHSLAYAHTIAGKQCMIKPQYSPEEIVSILQMRKTGNHTEYILANHINKFLLWYFNSTSRELDELDYSDKVTDPEARSFVQRNYLQISSGAKKLLAKMRSGELAITHDYYLKQFQLSAPALNFNYILFDEGQDASPAMLDVFLKQNAIKVIVGDTHQQIYSWRHAINSMEKAAFNSLSLTHSFRFSPEIAQLATAVLKQKQHLGISPTLNIKGKGCSSSETSKATLARTNLGLLVKAIEFITRNPGTKRIYFEGNINSYTYADDGASLFDILHLYNQRRHLIRNSLIREMRTIRQLEEYIQKTEDWQLAMMLIIVKEYGNRIPELLNTLRSLHVPDDEKHTAEMTFSTVHRCKGMEYDVVHLAEDFINEKQILNQVNDPEFTEADKPRLIEEINLLYVAVTRTRYKLYIPLSLLPEKIEPSEVIQITNTKKMVQADPVYEEVYQDRTRNKKKRDKQQYKPWSNDHDLLLTEWFCLGVTVKEMAIHFGRTEGAIRSRIKKLDLVNIYGES